MARPCTAVPVAGIVIAMFLADPATAQRQEKDWQGKLYTPQSVASLSFDWPLPNAEVPCLLKDLELWIRNVDTGVERGTIEKDRLGLVCTVSIPRKDFAARYQSCSLGSIESTARVEYLCGVVYYAQSVEFSYAYRTDDPAFHRPLCVFTCTRR
jgi:hypothetical protein